MTDSLTNPEVTRPAALQPQFRPDAAAAEPWSVLRPDGSLADGREAPLDVARTVEALRLMVRSRTFDDKGVALQRQGRFGTFSPVRGQEATVVGAAMAVDPGRDWLVPQYRELPALLHHGVPLERFMLTFMGDPAGGRFPDGVLAMPVQIALAAQLPHAVGLGWGLRLQGAQAVVLTFCGDGATSEGDFHEACNLAGVVRAPVVFVVQNNGWAISTPRARQSAARTLASRAPGYGMPGVLVDGNDLFAVYAATAQAVDRARRGAGPTLIETLTYRMGPHNTADDPTRYVDPQVAHEWAERDPILRVQRHLAGLGAWSDSDLEALTREARIAIEEAYDAAVALHRPGPGQLFDHLYAEPPQRLREQWDELRREEVTSR